MPQGAPRSAPEQQSLQQQQPARREQQQRRRRRRRRRRRPVPAARSGHVQAGLGAAASPPPSDVFSALRLHLPVFTLPAAVLPGTGMWDPDSDLPLPLPLGTGRPPFPGPRPLLVPHPYWAPSPVHLFPGRQRAAPRAPCAGGGPAKGKGLCCRAQTGAAPVGLGWEEIPGTSGLTRCNVPCSKAPAHNRRGVGTWAFFLPTVLNISARSSKQKSSFQPNGF
ncbi:fibroblast growth factor 18 isoform X1 [Panthera uncia]|uniref:fibroblast growth factor 18 isoform X1 n=1 Tax=Panthera uncia TaxID=29064 RepID=UPI0020FFEE94|nr:fibroblast growth factor 18 isoform X1 [Panthera uncia]